MTIAERIRQSVAEVERRRQESRLLPSIGGEVTAVKRFQARRFAGTYADLLASGPYAAAARFFLEELYGDRDFAERDVQFARIAGAVERLFPKDVAETAAALAELHALTESLDHAMAASPGAPASSSPAAYVAAWQLVGRRAERERQLERTLVIGNLRIQWITGIESSGSSDQGLGKVRINPPVPAEIGVSESAMSDRRSEPQMVQLAGPGAKTRLKVR